MITKFKHQRLFIRSNHHSTPPMTQPNFNTQQSSNDFINSLCKHKRFKEALQVFDFIQKTKTHFKINASTYAHLFLACSSLKSIEQGRKVHDHLVRSNSQPDIVLQNHILNMYGKCGSLVDARRLFDEMLERNVVTWASMIAGNTQNYREEEAVELYYQMQCLGLTPDQFTFGNVIRAASGLANIELGRQLHCHVIKSQFGFEPIVQNALVVMYAKFDRIENASVVFARIAKKDLISWGSMIAGFAQQGYELQALLLFKEMLFSNVHPNEFVFGSVFNACASLLQLDYGKPMHSLSIKYGLGSDAFAGCSLCDMYAKCGRLDSATKAFYQIERPDIVSWNAIICGFANNDDLNEAMHFFSRMRDSGLTPDQITVHGLLCACTSNATLCQGQQVHSFILKKGFDLDVSVHNTLVTMYSKCSVLSDAFNVFEERKTSRDTISWNAILTACMQHGKPDEAFRLITLMHTTEYKLDQITLSCILGASANLAVLDMGSQLHDFAIKNGLEGDLLVANGLIDMYSKCGTLKDARKLFELMGSPDVVSWSSLIVAYSQFGYGKEALELFDEMQGLGIKPNHVTFVGVLSACSHFGLVDEGCHYYKTMEVDYGIVPTREHCSCMVDLLGRAGRLTEAENFINQMSFDPDIIVWKTMLSACRLHRNVKLGKRAAESILKLDPSNSTAYVLLCNIYASSGLWDDVAGLRKLMRSRGVTKVPGKSWIEVKGKVNAFSVEDRSHPKTDEIYVMIRELCLHMREAGYVPNRRFGLNDLWQD